jgi:putative DNA primase/helicase
MHKLRPHDVDALCTKVTSGRYLPLRLISADELAHAREPRPPAALMHPDWAAALGALPGEVREWFQCWMGAAATGHPTAGGVLPVLAGPGENGKSLTVTDAIVPALGDYADTVSAKLVMAGRGTEHSTEMAQLRGQRLVVAEEMTEGRSLDVATLKRIQDVGQITARRVYCDNMTFKATHSLLCTTNYVPSVAESDQGTWRRLLLVPYPYTFRSPGLPLLVPTHRRGDPGLKRRIRSNESGQHDAIVTWIVEGAVAAAMEGPAALDPPETVRAATRDWRASADRILAYWTEYLIADKAARVYCADLLDEFNSWLHSNGHRPWSRETFTPKFESHSETAEHLVERRKTRDLDGLHRPHTVLSQDRPRRAKHPQWLWLGVRWRTDQDKAAAG